jgi:hypothetical protein
VQVIGINPSEDLNTIQNFVTMFGLTYPVLQDPGSFTYNTAFPLSPPTLLT